MGLQITLAPETEQEKLGLGKPQTTVDLEAYKTPIRSLETQMVGNGYSKWLKVTADSPDERKKAQRRFSQAAKALTLHVGYAKEEKQPKVLWLRLRPAPKARPGARKDAAGAAAS